LSNYDENAIFKTITEMRTVVERAKKETKSARRMRQRTSMARDTTSISPSISKHAEEKVCKVEEDLSDITPFDEIEDWNVDE
jgi:hypothetical protein